MSQAATPSSLVAIVLVMLFISGCWTIAAIMPSAMSDVFRTVMIAAVAASNVTFLLSVLSSVFSYAGLGEKETMRRVMLAFFSIGVMALIMSVMIFSVSYIIRMPPMPGYHD